MLNLRKKLQEYYRNEGKDDELVFELPKGAYHVNFRYSRFRQLKKTMYRRAPWLLLGSVALLGISLALLLAHPAPKTRIGFWKPFVRDHPVFLVLGDHYFFKSRIATGQTATVRDNSINSDADFEHFLSENPSLRQELSRSDLTYINNQAPIGLFHIMDILGEGKAKKMDYSSRIRMEDLRGYHTIFIGSFKTLHILAPVIEKTGLRYDIRNSLLEYHSADSVLSFDNRSDNYFNYEYACLIHFTAKDGRHVAFLLCDNDIGNIALVKYLTNEKTALPFEKILKQIKTDQFKAIFEVKGQQRTDFQISLVRVDPLPGNTAEIWP